MNITLVYRGRYHIRQALELEVFSAVLKNAGHDVTLVYDQDLFGVTDNVLQIPVLARHLDKPHKIVRSLLNNKPDIVFFSALPNTYQELRIIARGIRDQTSIPIVFLGLHSTLCPERVMQDSFVDYVIQGEAQDIVLPFLEWIKKDANNNTISGLWYRKDGIVFRCPVGRPSNIDELPLPDKELFSPYIPRTLSYTALISRGCPFACSFCEESSRKSMYGSHFYQRKSVGRVIEELEKGLERFQFKEVLFKDSYLNGDLQWLESFITEYRKKIGVPFKCFCTLSHFSLQVAMLLKQGGCYCIEFGIQTWNEQIRKEVLNRHHTNEGALAAFRACDKAKLKYDIDHIFQIPGENEEDHRIGARFYSQLKYLNRIKVHNLVYLPHSKIATTTHGISDSLGLENGSESDFYNKTRSENATQPEAYSTLYKVLPLFPGWLVEWWLQGRRILFLKKILHPLVLLIQVLIAFKNRDYRFLVYLCYYPGKVLKKLAVGR